MCDRRRNVEKRSTTFYYPFHFLFLRRGGSILELSRSCVTQDVWGLTQEEES